MLFVWGGVEVEVLEGLGPFAVVSGSNRGGSVEVRSRMQRIAIAQFLYPVA